MIGKIFGVLLLLLPLAASLYFLSKRKKTKFPWFLTALLILVVLMCLLAIGLYVFALIFYKQ